MKPGGEKEVIKAIHYKEVKEFLNSFYNYDKLGKEIVCHVCGTKIIAENFKALTLKGDKLLFFCDAPKCYKVLLINFRD